MSPTTQDGAGVKRHSHPKEQDGRKEAGPRGSCPFVVRVGLGHRVSPGLHGLCPQTGLLWVKAKVLYHGALVAKDSKRFHQVPRVSNPTRNPPLTWPQPGGRGGRAHTSSGHRRSWSSSGALPQERWLQTTGHLQFRHKDTTTRTPPLLSEATCPRAGYPKRGWLRP